MSHDTPHHEMGEPSPDSDGIDSIQFPDEFGTRSRPIELSAVSKTYGEVTAIETLSFTASTGEFHALVGPNGAGKTTLGRIAVGLTRPSAGTVTVPTGDIGYVFQQPRFYPTLSVRENIATFRRAVGDDAAPRDWHDDLLEALCLPAVDHQPAATLSGGFQKKLDIAIAVLRRPSYIWLDEPLAAVDAATASRLSALLEAYVDAGGGVIVSTHAPGAFDGALTHLTVCHTGSELETHALSDGVPNAVARECARYSGRSHPSDEPSR